MALNRGKEFEDKVEEQLKEMNKEHLNVSITRLYDTMMFDPYTRRWYSGVSNPCDYIVFKKPTQFMIECKSHEGNTINYNKLTQYEDLLSYSKIKGVIAGFLCWFIDHKEVYFVDVRYVEKKKLEGEKSININKLRTNEDIYVKKLDTYTRIIYPKINFEGFFYDMEKLKNIQERIVDNYDGELYGSNPQCKHIVVSEPSGGVKCIKCSGWFCY